MVHSTMGRFGCCLAIGLMVAATPAAADSVQEMLDADALVAAYNPELLDFLLEEGRDALPPEQRQAALDQLVTALRQDVDITPEEQKAAAMAAAGAGLAQLFGGSDGADYGGAAQDATYQIWSGWVDSAFTLQRAGYADQASAFFEKCVQVFPYNDLRGRCAIGLATADPNAAFDRLMALTQGNDNETIKAVLPLLGTLAGSEGFPQDLRGQAIARIEEFTGGLKKATFGVAACRGLVATGDERAVPELKKLSTGLMNADFFPCSRRGLLLVFHDTGVVPLLEKQLKGGMFSATKPAERLAAASLLMQAGEPAGFAFAEKELTKKQKKGLGKLMKSSDDVDLRPALVTALVRAGGPEAIRVLKSASAAATKGSWLETWIAVGLLELGDTSGIALARSALDNPEWAFTTVRVATALAANGDDSGIPALASLYESAARGVEPDWGKAALAFMAGEGQQYESGEKAKRARLVRLRRQIAGGLARIDRPACVPVLESMLSDDETSVRVASARALMTMQTPEAATGLVEIMGTDFGSFENRSRNPVFHAGAVRTAAARFAGRPATAKIVGAATASPFASVRFLGLCVAPAGKGAEAAAQ